ncbi:sulfurtransferase complex subunit TusB [Neptunicella sp.]|uniref:sulfurtransferase complex subunit TusB n=1 Tax=Neptunicella sp. TaxID=2125986 RepID=UPI003F68FF21
MLHIVKSSPFTHLSLQNCLNRLQPNDGLLLLEDGVYALLQRESWQSKLDANIKLYVLQDDAISRGVPHTAASVNWIDYPQFVQLTLDYPQSMSW